MPSWPLLMKSKHAHMQSRARYIFLSTAQRTIIELMHAWHRNSFTAIEVQAFCFDTRANATRTKLSPQIKRTLALDQTYRGKHVEDPSAAAATRRCSGAAGCSLFLLDASCRRRRCRGNGALVVPPIAKAGIERLSLGLAPPPGLGPAGRQFLLLGRTRDVGRREVLGEVPTLSHLALVAGGGPPASSAAPAGLGPDGLPEDPGVLLTSRHVCLWSQYVYLSLGWLMHPASVCLCPGDDTQWSVEGRWGLNEHRASNSKMAGASEPARLLSKVFGISIMSRVLLCLSAHFFTYIHNRGL